MHLPRNKHREIYRSYREARWCVSHIGDAKLARQRVYRGEVLEQQCNGQAALRSILLSDCLALSIFELP